MNKEANNKLGQCHACSGSVSKKAKTCPHCGQKKPIKNKSKLGGYILMGFAIWLLVSAINSASNLSSNGGDSSSAPGPDSELAREACENAIRVFANNPSTLKIHRISGYATNVDSAGTRRITQTFSAKNAFGLEKTFDAYCSMTAKAEFDINIVEQGI
jgi:hypothetical protein